MAAIDLDQYEALYLTAVADLYPLVFPHVGCSDDGIVVEGPPSLERRNTYGAVTCRHCGSRVDHVPQAPSVCYFVSPPASRLQGID